MDQNTIETRNQILLSDETRLSPRLRKNGDESLHFTIGKSIAETNKTLPSRAQVPSLSANFHSD
jgi:hypothetical protein